MNAMTRYMIPNTLPDALKDAKAWVAWKFMYDPDRPEKPRKVPYYVTSNRERNGTQNTPDDLAGMVSFDEAVRGCIRGNFDGVGFALRDELGIVALDFDDCVNDGAIDPVVQELVADTYAEFSPSGTGVRAFMFGALPNKKSFKGGNENWPYGFETFCKNGFVTVTGKITPVCDMMGLQTKISGLTPSVEKLFEKRFGSIKESNAPSDQRISRQFTLARATAKTVEDVRRALASLPEEYATDYDKWINTGEALKSLAQAGFDEDARELWHEHSSRSAGQYSPAQADEKWTGFNPNKITFVSIFGWAQDNGWINPASAAAIKTGDAETFATLPDRSDTGNCNLMIKLAGGDLRFVPERGLWIWWDGERWLADRHGVYVHAAANAVGQHYYAEAEKFKQQAKNPALQDEDRKRIHRTAADLEKWAKHCRNRRGIDSMLALAKTDARVIVEAERLDCDPWLLGVANGVVDLRTGELRPDARDEFVTLRSPCAYDAEARAPRFKQFINEITGSPLPAERDSAGRVKRETVGKYVERPQLAHYLQRAYGYFSTGSPREQKMFVEVGPGSNGKNVLNDLVQEVLGDYARNIDPEGLMASKADKNANAPTPSIARLAGARFAVASEAKEGQRFDVALIKRHTGESVMTARHLHGQLFQFLVTHKLILMTNHMPSLDHLDRASRGRLHIIPFDRAWNRPGEPDRDDALPDGDKELKNKLRDEAAGILAWLVEGARTYFSEGLEPPSIVADKTKEYFAEQDPIGLWLKTVDFCDPQGGTLASALLKNFQQWVEEAETEGVAFVSPPMNPTAFAMELKARAVASDKTKHGKRYALRIRSRVTGDG